MGSEFLYPGSLSDGVELAFHRAKLRPVGSGAELVGQIPRAYLVQNTDAPGVRPGPMPVDALNMGVFPEEGLKVIRWEVLGQAARVLSHVGPAEALVEMQAQDAAFQLAV